MPDLIMVDDIVDQFTPGQLAVCAHRAAMKLDYEVELNPDGSINTTKLSEAVDIHDDGEFLEAFTWELQLMAAATITHRLVADGLAYEDGVNEDGEVLYRAVPE